jgi:hypothetical protein
MTQTAARRIAPEDVGDPEPVGLASSWSEEPPARRALAVEDSPHFQATPVRVDEAFPEYEAYHSVIEMPTYDAVSSEPGVQQSPGWGETPVVALSPVPRTEDYGWVPGAVTPQHVPSVAPGLVPYPMTPTTVSVHQLPADTYAVPAPVHTAYGAAAAPNPYQATYPVPQAPADMYAAVPPGPYANPVSDSQTDVALMAVGGTLLAVKQLATVAPFVVVSVFFTIVAANVGGGAWIMAAFSWLITFVAIFARPTNARMLLRLYGRK